MTYNKNDGVYYMTSDEFAADTTVKAMPSAKVYVYQTGKLYVSDGTMFHELGVADA